MTVTQTVPAAVTIKNPYIGKNYQIIGIVLFIFCGIGSCATIQSKDSVASGILALGAGAGLVMYLVGRFKHWYHAE